VSEARLSFSRRLLMSKKSWADLGVGSGRTDVGEWASGGVGVLALG